MKQNFILLTIFLILLTACGQIPSTPGGEITPTSATGITPIDLEAGFGVAGPWFELYFTDPTSPLSPQGTGGVDGPLVDAIDRARLSIDAAAYSLSLNSVRFALINAHKRGVQVRVVMESSNMDRSDPRALIEAGIPVIGDNMDGLMHDKFIVIDKSEIWLGSMNFTDSGAYDDNNHLMRIHSTKLAENYSLEFKEMFEDNMFGPNIVPQTPNPIVTLDGTMLENYFSPDDGVINALAEMLTGARESIYFLTFSFTSNELGDILRAKNEAGLKIAGVMDEEQVSSNQGTEFDPFKQADMDVRIDGIPGQMHHKVFIVDEEIVVLGSYNFSQNAELRNDENVIIVHSPVIAQQFLMEFERVQKMARDD